jgi:hypothetical protein
VLFDQDKKPVHPFSIFGEQGPTLMVFQKLNDFLAREKKQYPAQIKGD